MKKSVLLILLMTLQISCFNSPSSGVSLSLLGFYSDPDEIISVLKNAPRGHRENFLLGMAYRQKKDLKKAIFYLSNSCFLSHRNENLRLYAQPVYSFLKGFHRKSEYYNDAVAGIAEMFFLYREYEHVVKLTGLVGNRDRALYRDTVLLRSRALDELKRFAESLDVLTEIQKKYNDSDSSALIYIRRAGVYEKMKNPQEAFKDYIEILRGEGAVWHKSIAVKRIMEITSRNDITLSEEERFLLGRGLFQNGDYTQALGVFSDLEKGEKDAAMREKVLPFAVRCLVRKRNTTAALAAVSKHPKIREMEKTIADELWNAGRKRESSRLYRKLADGKGDIIALDSLERLALYAEENNGGADDGFLSRYIKEYPKGPYREYFIWRLGRNELRRKNHAAALEHFTRGLKEYPEGSSADAMRFWSWKILRLIGKEEEAGKHAMDLVALHPDSTYTWTLMDKIKGNADSGKLHQLFNKAVSERDRAAYLFAHMMLFIKDGNMKERDKRIERLPSAETSPYRNIEKKIGTMAVSSRNRSLLRSIEKYFAVGYTEGIGRELNLVPDDEQGRRDKNLALAHWGRMYHHYYHALYSSLDLMREYKLKENIGIMPGEGIDCFFPRPFGKCVKSSSREFKIDVNMIYAVMKAESLFYPRSVSSAGAIGLMQLMPGTARGIARELKEKKYNLKSPCVSIRFGTHYVAWLKRFFKGKFDLMVAGYNAGAGNVKKWRKNKQQNDDDLFAEFIPFDETRYYVVRTRKFLSQYRLLYR